VEGNQDIWGICLGLPGVRALSFFHLLGLPLLLRGSEILPELWFEESCEAGE
jgi:hypothetical protein